MILLAKLSVLLTVLLIFLIIFYVISSYAHMKALKALDYDKAWLAWIPFGCAFACADAIAPGEEPVEMFGSFTVPVVLFKLWWLLIFVFGWVPYLGGIVSILLNIVFMGSIYSKMFAELDEKTESEEQIVGCLSGFLPIIAVCKFLYIE